MTTWPLAEIESLLAPTLKHMGYSIYGLQRTGQGGRTLRIAIDKPEGFVGIDDCEAVSRVAGPLLDQAALIDERYLLEISSPGAERELRDRREYERHVGRTVNSRYRLGDSEAVIEGLLAAVNDTGIEIAVAKREPLRLPWPEVITTRLVASLKRP
ncbi:MAG: ribosome maturation factor RimP [Candidatus Dormibacteraeota bacterium]|nr:ribosome maturation factor RimP [Candidatus Dormibacteraeota bacterium]